MQTVWLYTLSSILIVSAVSLIGVITIVIKQDYIKKILLFFVSFAAGALLGDVFIHMLPELVESGKFSVSTSLCVVGGILLFFILEKILHWRHCHLSATKDHIHPLAHMNLIGDTIHNFMDGVIIAGSFLISVPVGIATSLAVILHEIPQEMGDFGILLHSGMSVRKSLFFNFVTALSAFVGGIFTLVISPDTETVIQFILPFTMGGFLYIAGSDLIPELHKDVKPLNSLIQLLSLILGVGIMFMLLNFG
jgi:zinc and cadmium transporter